METDKKQLIEEYERGRKKTIKIIISLFLIAAGLTSIIFSVVSRCQEATIFEDKGLVLYKYHHVLMEDSTHYNFLGLRSKKTLKYFIVYTSANGLEYREETDFITYSQHANKENVAPGRTDHSVITTLRSKYTYLGNDNRTYCYDEDVSAIKVFFDVGNDGLILRIIADLLGAAAIAAGIILIVKAVKKSKKEALS